LADAAYSHMLRPVLRFRKPTERGRDWLAVIPVGALYLGLGQVMQNERAFLAALSVGVFYVIISREWDQRHQTRFWTVMSGFAVIHLAALSLVQLPHYTGPGIGLAFPFMFADGFLMWGILNWIEKRFPTATQ
jgi:hypothetical protein